MLNLSLYTHTYILHTIQYTATIRYTSMLYIYIYIVRFTDNNKNKLSKQTKKLSLDLCGYLEAGGISLLVAQSPVDLQTDSRIDWQYLEAVLVRIRLACLQRATDLILSARIVDMRAGTCAIIAGERQRHIQDDTLYIGGELSEVTFRLDLHHDAGLRVALQCALVLRTVRDGHIVGG